MQTIGGFEASWFMICGQAVLADIFRPETRGTAIGFFMAGTAVGRGLGPCIGGIIVTYAPWRVIFWLQVFMTGLGLILSLLFVPPEDRPLPQVVRSTAAQFSPMRVIELLIYPNILFTDISYGLLSWVMYTILASPRSIINPRFGLTTPLVSGLFYIAPGIGLVVGTTLGGKWADITVCRYIIKRNGKRIPQDRLNSGILSFFVIAPFSLILYGWSLQEKFGGLALPSIAIFFTSIGLMVGSSSLNTYCTEVMPNKRTEVMAGKYFIQYTLSAAGNASALPLISLTGVGVSCTLEAMIIIIGGLLIFATTRRGSHMQNWIERIKEGNVNEDLKVGEKMDKY
jgi:MFS family permease